MRTFDLIEELPDIIAQHFPVLDEDYRRDQAYEAAHAIGEHLELSYDVRFVLINEEGQLDSTMLYEDRAEAEKAAGDRCMVATLLAEALDRSPTPPAPESVTQEAKDAFWGAVVKRYPEAKSGDLSPETTLALDRTAKTAIEEWVHYNVPRKAIGGAA